MLIELPRMLTMREAAKETGLSYNAVREMCLNDKIVYCKSGKKYYINVEKLVEYLNRGDGANETSNPIP